MTEPAGIMKQRLNLKKLSLSDQVLRTIRLAILEGKWPKGHKLREEELAQQLNVSRNALRTALSMLEAEGLVEGTPYQGRVVAEVRMDQYSYLKAARALLEPVAVEKAIGNLDDESIKDLRRTARLMRDSELDYEDFINLDIALHEYIWALTNDTRLEKLLRQVVYPFFALHCQYEQPRGADKLQERERSLQSHQVLVDAICRRDTKAAIALMREHVTWSYIDNSEAKDLVQRQQENVSQQADRISSEVLSSAPEREEEI